MHLNTIAGRTYNDLSQYPVVSISGAVLLMYNCVLDHIDSFVVVAAACAYVC